MNVDCAYCTDDEDGRIDTGSPDDPSLHIDPVLEADVGVYTCVVGNDVGETQSDEKTPEIWCKCCIGQGDKNHHCDH